MVASWDGPVIETYTGGQFAPLDPDSSAVRLPDIAAGLAQTCRFGGHCQQFYSVAHHSLHVSHEFGESRLQLLGLFHDAAEAYLGDIPRPIKAELEGIARAEQAILDTVWEAFGVDSPTAAEWEEIQRADDRLLAYEAPRLLVDGSWAGDSPELEYTLSSDDIGAVREQFQSRAERLLESVG